jgi:hypothetical protein
MPLPDEPVIGASSVHELLSSWRRTLQGEDGGIGSAFKR